MVSNYSSTVPYELESTSFYPSTDTSGNIYTQSNEIESKTKSNWLKIAIGMGIIFTSQCGTHTTELTIPTSHEYIYNGVGYPGISPFIHTSPSVTMVTPIEAINMDNEKRYSQGSDERHQLIHQPLSQVRLVGKVQYIGSGTTRARILEAEASNPPVYHTPITKTVLKGSIVEYLQHTDKMV